MYLSRKKYRRTHTHTLTVWDQRDLIQIESQIAVLISQSRLLVILGAEKKHGKVKRRGATKKSVCK